MTSDEITAAAERLIAETEEFGEVLMAGATRYGFIAKDVLLVARAALEAGQEVDKSQTLAASLSEELHRVGKEVGRLRGFIRGVIDKDVPEGDEAAYLNAIKWAAPFALRRAVLSTAGGTENGGAGQEVARVRSEAHRLHITELMQSARERIRIPETEDCPRCAALFTPGRAESSGE